MSKQPTFALLLANAVTLGLSGSGEIEFRDVAGIELDHRPSRMSEMICALSVPPESFA